MLYARSQIATQRICEYTIFLCCFVGRGVDLTAVAGAVGFSGRKSYRVHGPPKPSSTTVIVCKARGLGYLQMHTALLY